VLVNYTSSGAEWSLIVADNGIGKKGDPATRAGGGLGTAIVQALAKQLGARIDISNNVTGTGIAITYIGITSTVGPA
jgi:chemotaxis protein methyltransferase CheR